MFEIIYHNSFLLHFCPSEIENGLYFQKSKFLKRNGKHLVFFFFIKTSLYCIYYLSGPDYEISNLKIT